ncbi:hypothetical protein JW796_02215 [Candidatus Dojkabacteria bacterium]|nr:hypothetical protein [Candidatus Dojkabacteria bacterium]
MMTMKVEMANQVELETGLHTECAESNRSFNQRMESVAQYLLPLIRLSHGGDLSAFYDSFQDYLNAYETISHENIDYSQVIIQINEREQLQSPFSVINPLPENISRLACLLSPGSMIELNAPGQIEPNGNRQTLVDNIEQILKEAPGVLVGLHAGATRHLTGEIKDILTNFNEEQQKRIIIKMYGRMGKYDPAELIETIDSFDVVNSDNLRVGLEHIFSCVYQGFDQGGSESEASEIMQAYFEILDILKNKGITRISMPETRGIAEDPAKVFAVTSFLLESAAQVLGDSFYVEFHFHNDSLSALSNMESAIKAVNYLNRIQGSNIIAIADLGIGGERNGITPLEAALRLFGINEERIDALVDADKRLLGIDFDVNISNTDNLSDPELLLTQTAGTHADYIYNTMKNLLVHIVPDVWMEDIADVADLQRVFEGNREQFLEFGIFNFTEYVTVASYDSYAASRKRITHESPDVKIEPSYFIDKQTIGKRSVMLHLVMNGFSLIDTSPENISAMTSHISHECKIDLTGKFNGICELAQTAVVRIKEKYSNFKYHKNPYEI